MCFVSLDAAKNSSSFLVTFNLTKKRPLGFEGAASANTDFFFFIDLIHLINRRLTPALLRKRMQIQNIIKVVGPLKALLRN